MIRGSSVRMSFNPPADYYCEELAPLDEQVCGLIAKRKELSENNPGFPELERIESWSKQFGLDENWLRRVFASLHNERHYSPEPPIEPAGFLKFVPILKSVEIDQIIYAVTHMKQYSNASVVYIEVEVNRDEPNVRLRYANFDLAISPEYRCRMNGGSGHSKWMQHSFIVTPPLPDNLSGIEFRLSAKRFPQEPEIQELSLPEIPVTIK